MAKQTQRVRLYGASAAKLNVSAKKATIKAKVRANVRRRKS